MRAVCEHCGKQYAFEDRLLGKKVRCRSCGQPFRVYATEAELNRDDAGQAPTKSEFVNDNFATSADPAQILSQSVAVASAKFAVRKKSKVDSNRNGLIIGITAGSVIVILLAVLLIQPWSTTSDSPAENVPMPSTPPPVVRTQNATDTNSTGVVDTNPAHRMFDP